MKNILRLFVVAAWALYSCSGNSIKEEKTTEKSSPPSISRIRQGELEQHRNTIVGSYDYSLYVPSGYTADRIWPVTILLDPHAEAAEIIGKYQKTAEAEGRLLICPEGFRNGLGMDQSNEIVAAIVQEAVSTLHVDPAAVHLMGFSGGAKAALAAAYSLQGISTVTYCGAAFPQATAPVKIPSLGIAGFNDMNFTEVLNYTTALDTTPLLHGFLVTRSKHEWPSAEVFGLTTAWAHVWRCRNGGTCDTARIATIAALSRKMIEKEKEPVLRDLLLHFQLAAFDGIINTDKEKREMDANQRSPLFRNAMSRFIGELEVESRERERLSDAFNTKDLSWWRETIAGMNNRSQDALNTRLLGYISLACYSYSRSTLDEGNQQFADHFLSLYELADPKNAEWAYLRACLAAQRGESEMVFVYLEKAKTLGFHDVEKVRAEKWLQGVKNDSRWTSFLENIGQRC